MMGIVFAQALYALAEEEHCTDRMNHQIQLLGTLILQNPRFSTILDCPALAQSEKDALLNRCFQSDLHPYLLNGIKCMSRRKAAHEIPKMAEEFMRLYRRAHQIESVLVITAVPISETLQKKLQQKLETISKKSIELSMKVDPSILGGICIQMENTQIDNTLKTRLSAIEKQIKSAVL